MAMFTYRCKRCGFTHEAQFTHDSRPLETIQDFSHDSCDSTTLHRVWYATTINLGWQPVKGHDNVDKWMFEHGNKD